MSSFVRFAQHCLPSKYTNKKADELSYAEHVIVAETDCKFSYECSAKSRKANPRVVKHTLRMGTVEWDIAFNDQKMELEFRCLGSIDLLGPLVEPVHMELISYCRHQSVVADSIKELYMNKQVKRHIFTHPTSTITCNLASWFWFRSNETKIGAYLFTIRILKPRSMFPNFTLVENNNTVNGRWASDGKLRVGAQVFHVNKQLLTMYTDYFELLFNNPAYTEASQEVVELKHVEHADPAVFHDFLLTMCVAEALPNPKNLAALFHLSNIYQVQNVRDKCQLHLTMCHEMAVEERYVLALENGSKELQGNIRRNLSKEESESIIAAVSKKAVAF